MTPVSTDALLAALCPLPWSLSEFSAPSQGMVMTQDVTRWLTEIRTLQQQLAALRQERDQAYQSAANWRKLYETEARQHREAVEHLEMTVKTLRTELSTLRNQQETTPSLLPSWAEAAASTSQTADQDTVAGLRAQLVAALQTCEQLQAALDAERASHEEIRQTLTTALGETIDALRARNALTQRSLDTAAPPTAED